VAHGLEGWDTPGAVIVVVLKEFGLTVLHDVQPLSSQEQLPPLQLEVQL